MSTSTDIVVSFLGGVILALLNLFISGAIVQFAFNVVIPTTFNVPEISYSQATALYLLVSTLRLGVLTSNKS